jgi:hypothetical protein
MQIDGLERIEASRAAHSVVTLFHPADREGGAHIRVERLSSGLTHIEYLEGGKQPKVDPTEEMFVRTDDSPLVERLVRAMAVRHLGVQEASSNLTPLDLEMLARGFTLGVSDAGSPVWVRLAAPMTVVVHRREADGLPNAFEDEVTAICIIPGRRNVKFECGNVRSALKVADTNMALEVSEAKNTEIDEDDMVVIPLFLDRKSVVIH